MYIVTATAPDGSIFKAPKGKRIDAEKSVKNLTKAGYKDATYQQIR